MGIKKLQNYFRCSQTLQPEKIVVSMIETNSYVLLSSTPFFEERSMRRGVNKRYYYFCKDAGKYMQLTCIKLPHRSGYLLLEESG